MDRDSLDRFVSDFIDNQINKEQKAEVEKIAQSDDASNEVK